MIGFKRSRLLRAVAVGSAAMLLAAGCGGGGGKSSNDDSSGKPHQGGVLKASSSAEIRSFDPVDISTYFTSGGDRAIAIYGSLMKYDDKGEAVPAMAKSFTSNNGKVWTLKLREGVKFTDGTAFDAEAVKFNLDRQKAPDSPSTGKPYLADVTELKVIDPLTLQFTLSKTNGSFSALFAQNSNLGFIGSPTAIKKDPKGFGTHPVGAGPYVLKEWVHDDHVTFVRNKDYWDAPRPYVDEIDFYIVTDNQTALQSLQSGQLNLAGPLKLPEWSQIKDNPKFRVYTAGPLGSMVFFPNVNRGPGKDLQVRKAIQMAFDPKASNKVLNQGLYEWDGNVGCLPFGKDSGICSDKVPDYNLEKAKQIIADYKAKGNSVDMTLLTVASSLGYISKYQQQVLNSIGLNVKLDQKDRATFTPAVIKGDYDSATSIVLPFANAYPKVFNFFDVDGTNYPKQHDDELEADLVQSRDGKTKEERDAGWQKVLDRVNEQGYVVWMCPAPLHPASTADVHLGNAWAAGGTVWYPADAWID